MRKAKETDYWEKVYRRKYTNSLMEIQLNGYNELQTMSFSKGITAICGLNGAGKSTIISAIKSIIGVQLSDSDLHKLTSANINGRFEYNNKQLMCSNIVGEQFSDKGGDLEYIKYLDCDENTKIQEFNIKQANFEDLLEQNEDYELSQEEVEEISYLTGKKYEKCKIWEFEDIEGLGTVPYFEVEIDQIEYDSRSMGKGEHFLFYLFWCINKCNSDTIVIIEEPETYISISSQMHFSNYLGKKIAEKGLQIILTTHSPYLLEHIRNENIRIISRIGNMATIIKPSDSMMAEDILGIKQNNMGVLFVEDRVACDFLSIILEDKAPYVLKKYTIDVANGGENAISQRLEFPTSDKMKYNIIGVYDGDMRERLNTKKLNWNWLFLPGNKPLEELYRDYLHSEINVDKFCNIMGRDKGQIITMLATIDGYDYHDWFEELRKYLVVDGKTLVRNFYIIMTEMNDEVEMFIKELKDCIK